jgi:hypothetical protein
MGISYRSNLSLIRCPGRRRMGGFGALAARRPEAAGHNPVQRMTNKTTSPGSTMGTRRCENGGNQNRRKASLAGGRRVRRPSTQVAAGTKVPRDRRGRRTPAESTAHTRSSSSVGASAGSAAKKVRIGRSEGAARAAKHPRGKDKKRHDGTERSRSHQDRAMAGGQGGKHQQTNATTQGRAQQGRHDGRQDKRRNGQTPNGDARHGAHRNTRK